MAVLPSTGRANQDICKLLDKSPITDRKIADSSAITDPPIADSSTFRLIFIRADLVFGGRHWIVRQSFHVYARAVRVADLFVSRVVAFDRAFVNVGILSHAERHWRHGGPPEWLRWRLL